MSTVGAANSSSSIEDLMGEIEEQIDDTNPGSTIGDTNGDDPVLDNGGLPF